MVYDSACVYDFADMKGLPMPEPELDLHRKLAKRTFNATWDLLDKPDRTSEEDELMKHTAHAFRYHWSFVGGPQQFSVGDWQLSRVYATLGDAVCALHYARLSLMWTEKESMPPWAVAYAHEAIARALKLNGDLEGAAAAKERALAVVGVDRETADRLRTDLESV